MAEIVANLLENAFRYSAPQGPVGLHLDQDPHGGLSLTVWDGGPEIPVGERERIFERGQRGSTGLHLSGTGLGLALARDLARGLGGELELIVPPQRVAQDLPAEGNAFQLSLPPPLRADGPPADPPAP